MARVMTTYRRISPYKQADHVDRSHVSWLETAQQMEDRPNVEKEDILDPKLEHAIDEYEGRDEDYQPKHHLITFDISLEQQALPQA